MACTLIITTHGRVCQFREVCQFRKVCQFREVCGEVCHFVWTAHSRLKSVKDGTQLQGLTKPPSPWKRPSLEWLLFGPGLSAPRAAWQTLNLTIGNCIVRIWYHPTINKLDQLHGCMARGSYGLPKGSPAPAIKCHTLPFYALRVGHPWNGLMRLSSTSLDTPRCMPMAHCEEMMYSLVC
jgi:hypothetical protein